MKKLLLVVDFQNDFVSGSLGFPGAELLEKPICDKIKAYQTNKDDVAYTMDTHGSDYLATQEGKKLPIPHCLEGSEGWKLYGGTRYLLAYCTCFEKDTFGSRELLPFLREGKYNEIELVGLVSNICVLSNAVIAKAVLPEARIVVDAACVGSGDSAMQEKAFDLLENLHIEVVNRK